MEEVEPGLLSALLLGGHMLLVAGLAVRILFRHLPVGTTLAWLIVLFVLPVFGPALYLFIGENRLRQKRAARWRLIHSLYREWQGRLKARAAARAGASPELPLAGLAHFLPPLLVGAAMESGETPPSRSSVGYRDYSPKQRAEKGRGKREQKNMQLLSFRLDLLFEKQPELVLEHGPPDDYKKYKYRGDRGRKPPGSIHIGHRSVSVFAHSPAQVFPAPG